MRITSLAACMILAATACDRLAVPPEKAPAGDMAIVAASHKEAKVTEARIRLPAVSGRPGVAYFVIQGGDAGGVLSDVSTPAAKRAEMHETVTKDGIVSMAPIMRVDVPAGSAVAFEPGGMHLMLFDLDPALKSGDRAALSFRFAGAAPVTVEAQVRGAGEDHDGH